MSHQRTKRPGQLEDAAGVLGAAILLPLIIIYAGILLLAGLLLYVTIWCCWCSRGRYVLFVYSDSPVWHDYIEKNLLPRLGDRAIVLNWSQRRRWRPTLSVLTFYYFSGYRAFNPLAMVFRPFRLARKFRFYEPFRDFKHGKTATVSKMEKNLCDLVDEITGSRPA